MKRTTILMDEQQTALLEEMAARTGRSLDDLVHDAVQEYVERLNGGNVGVLPPQTLPDAEWQARLAVALDRFRSRVDPAWSENEQESDITAARDEVRRERAARRVSDS